MSGRDKIFSGGGFRGERGNLKRTSRGNTIWGIAFTMSICLGRNGRLGGQGSVRILQLGTPVYPYPSVSGIWCTRQTGDLPWYSQADTRVITCRAQGTEIWCNEAWGNVVKYCAECWLHELQLVDNKIVNQINKADQQGKCLKYTSQL